MSGPERTSSVRRWVSPRWPIWPVALKISLDRGKTVLVRSVEIVVSRILTPTAIEVESNTGHSIGRAEYGPPSNKPQKVLLVCNPSFEASDLELTIEEPYYLPQNFYHQVLIKRISITYSLLELNCHKKEKQPSEIAQNKVENQIEIAQVEIAKCLANQPVNDYHNLRDICTKSIGRLRQRHHKCEQLRFVEECCRLNQSIAVLSQLLDDAYTLERKRLMAINSNKESEAKLIMEHLYKLYHQAEEELKEIDSFDPVALLHSEPTKQVQQTELKEETNSDEKKVEFKVNPYTALDFAESQTLISESDRKKIVKPLYELFSSDAVEVLLFSSSDNKRLQALHRCLTMIRHNLSDCLYISASERLVNITCYDSFFKVRQLSLVIAELLCAPDSSISIAVYFLCDPCKDIRIDAVRILSKFWSQSEKQRIIITQHLAKEIPAGDWRTYLGYCFAIHRFIIQFDCCEYTKDSRICLSVVMPLITRALQHQHQSVRSAAASICNEIELRLGPESTEPYLNKIDPLSMLPELDQTTDGSSTNETDNHDQKDVKASNTVTPSDVMHFIPTAKNVEELLQIWSF